jgi:hypothetical protein
VNSEVVNKHTQLTGKVQARLALVVQ